MTESTKYGTGEQIRFSVIVRVILRVRVRVKFTVSKLMVRNLGQNNKELNN